MYIFEAYLPFFIPSVHEINFVWIVYAILILTFNKIGECGND
jgi:hypothetical protein